MADKRGSRGKVFATPYEDHLREYLKDPEEAVGFLNICLEDKDIGTFLYGVRLVIEVNGGFTKVARKTGLNRENLYKMLSKEGNPRIESLHTVLEQLGLSVSIVLTPSKKVRSTSAKRKRAA